MSTSTRRNSIRILFGALVGVIGFAARFLVHKGTPPTEAPLIGIALMPSR